MRLPFGLDLVSLIVGIVLYHLFLMWRKKKSA